MKMETYQEFLDRIDSYCSHILFDTQKCFVPDDPKIYQYGSLL